MTDRILPRYPIYIPSKGRFDKHKALTVRFFLDDEVPFWLVVEEPEYEQYAKNWPKDRILVLPFKDLGSVIFARNWIKEHARAAGHQRHWQFDDNIRQIYRRFRRTRIRCNSAAMPWQLSRILLTATKTSRLPA